MGFLFVAVFIAIFVGAVVYVIMNHGQKSEKAIVVKERKKLYELEDQREIEHLTRKYLSEFLLTVTNLITNIINESKSDYSNFSLDSFNVWASTSKHFKVTFGYKTKIITFNFHYSLMENENATNRYDSKKGIIIVDLDQYGIKEEVYNKKYDMNKSHEILSDIENFLGDDENLSQLL